MSLRALMMFQFEALMYPLPVACKSISSLQRAAAQGVVDIVRQYSNTLVDQACYTCSQRSTSFQLHMAAALFFTRSVVASRLKLCRYLVGEATARMGLPPAGLERPGLLPNHDSVKDVHSKDAGLMQNLNDSQSSEEEEFECPKFSSIELVCNCLATQRPFVRLDTWGYAANGSSQMNLFLITYLHNARSPRPYLAQMIVRGAIPNLTTFSLLIQSYCQHLRYHHIVDVVFTQMKALGVEGDECFYKTLMERVCASFGPLTGFQLLKKMRSINGIQIPLTCYNVIVGQFRRRKRLQNSPMVWLLLDVLKDMKKHGVFVDEKIYNWLVNAPLPLYLVRSNVIQTIGLVRRNLIQATTIARQNFAEGIKIGAVSLNIAQRRCERRQFHIAQLKCKIKYYERRRTKCSCENRRSPRI